MMIVRLVVILGVLISIVGCDSKNTNDKEKYEGTGVISQGHLDALEKTKGVEQVLKDAEEKRRKEMK